MTNHTRKNIINDYMNSGFKSFKNTDSDEYIDQVINYKPILEYEMLYDNDMCLVIFFFTKDVSKEIINSCYDFFTKFILLDAKPIGDPLIISSELRKKLPNKQFMVYIGKTLAIDYKIVQENNSIVKKEFKEDMNNIYNQRKINDEFSSYIDNKLNDLEYESNSIEKSFNNNFLIIKLKSKDIKEAVSFFESKDFIDELKLSKHDFINEIRIVQMSNDNKVTTINLNRGYE